MLKPTSTLITRVLATVTDNPRVQESLSKRDYDAYTRGDAILCRFYRRDPQNSAVTFYIVEFKFATKYPEDEQNDDIGVLVQVTEGPGSSVEMKITDVKFF